MQEKRMECVTSTQGSPIAATPLLFQCCVSRLQKLWPFAAFTDKKNNNPKTIFYVFERRKITFKSDDLCCVPVLNNSGGPTYWGPLDSSAIVGVARGWHAFVLQDNDYRSLGNAEKILTFFFLSLFAGEVSAESKKMGRIARHSSVCHPRIVAMWPVPCKCPCKTTYISSAPMKYRAL